MALPDSLRQFYQIALLDIIAPCDLRRMYVRQTHDAEPLSEYQLRLRIYKNWDSYADDIRRWCEETITGDVTYDN